MSTSTLNLAGRIPRTTTAMRSTIIYFGAALAIGGFGFIVYGFHYRFQKKEEQKETVTAQVMATDAATSNRAAIQGIVPGTTPAAALGGGTPPPQPAQPGAVPVAVNSGLKDLKNAVTTVATPFGTRGPSGQPVQPSSPTCLPLPNGQPGYCPPQPVNYAGNIPMQQPQPQMDPAVRMKAEREQRNYERRLAAIDAPTSASQTSSGAMVPAKPADPLQAALSRLNSFSGQANSLPVIPAQSGSYPPVGARIPVQGRDEDEDPNGLEAKRDFQKTSDGDYLKTTRTAPISPWVVQRGEVIPAGLPNQIVSDLPGDLIAEVKRDVYDSPTHKVVLIPAGSLLAGEYNSGVTYGQKRAQVIWTYLRFPDGSFVDLEKFVSHAADGSVGLSDQVDNHLKRLVGGVALSSLFAAGVQISTGHNSSNVLAPSNTQLAASAAGQQAAEVGQQITSRNLNVQPTLKIRAGEIFAVSVMKSIIFPGPYKPLDLGGRK